MTDTSFILWIQQFSNGFLDRFFTIITTVGNPEYYMIAFPLIYWCINKRQAFRFTLFFLITSYVNTVTKGLTDFARPASDEVRVLYAESTYGSSSFPSGHTQGAASFWGYLAHQIKNKYFTVFAIILILLVGLSRIYLGVHFPIDIVAGLIFAVVILVLYNILYERVAEKLKDMSFGLKLGLSAILPLFLLIPPGHDKGMLVGFAIGLMVGYQIEGKYLDFSTKASILKQVIKFVIGIVGLFGLRVILKELFATIGLIELTEQGADALRYLVIGLWASYLAPMVFVKLGLADKRDNIDINTNKNITLN